MKKTAGKGNASGKKKGGGPASGPTAAVDKTKGSASTAQSLAIAIPEKVEQASLNMQNTFYGGGFDKRLDVLETINKFSEEYLASLIEDDLILDDRVRQEMPSRLEALQNQLDRLELDNFNKQRGELIVSGSGQVYQHNDALVASVNAKANQTEISLSTLKARLGEMHQKLLVKQQQVAKSAADKKAALVPPKVKLGEFPAEGDAFDDETDLEGSDDYFGSAFDTDDYLDDLDAGVLRGGMLDMKQVIFAAQKDVEQQASGDITAKAEGEVQNVLAIFGSPNMTLEEKLHAVQPKLRAVIQQDLYWRAQADKSTRQVHDLRMQKRIAEMELERVKSINGRLEGFCKDLQSENRKIKIESAKVEEAMNTAIEFTTTPPVSAPSSSHAVQPRPEAVLLTKKERKKAAKNKDASPSLGFAMPKPPEPSFPLPPVPSREVLEAEQLCKVIDRLLVLADLYQARENHFKAINDGHEIGTKICQEKILEQQLLLERTIVKLEEGESRVNQLARSEAELKSQVRQYVEKFRQVEETLVKSNELFGTFRGEMEQMSVKLARFERENHQMQTKCQTLSRNIIEMADERTKLTGSIETLKAQKAKLEQLCRTLQAERAAARKAEEEAPKEAEDESTELGDEHHLAAGTEADQKIRLPNGPNEPPSTAAH